ncbi:MAG: tRNA (adenosine(37)-N6)-threonylcarbamoyltransferase complex ATPase subunit type 1 TsaE [Bacilli bacterium]|jgi:tRNA threonylcarbamoyladenosine biosynthesis protein TsaE
MSILDNQKYKITTRSEEETIDFAQNIELEKLPNMVICLEGDLGSGKTVFAKGMAAALNINEVITSPTFNIIKEYFSGKTPFYHIDVYRLDGKIDNLGLEDYFNKEGIIVIEWADTIKGYLPEERLEIKIKIVSENVRVLILKPYGEKYENLCEALL